MDYATHKHRQHTKGNQKRSTSYWSSRKNKNKYKYKLISNSSIMDCKLPIWWNHVSRVITSSKDKKRGKKLKFQKWMSAALDPLSPVIPAPERDRRYYILAILGETKVQLHKVGSKTNWMITYQKKENQMIDWLPRRPTRKWRNQATKVFDLIFIGFPFDYMHISYSTGINHFPLGTKSTKNFNSKIFSNLNSFI